MSMTLSISLAVPCDQQSARAIGPVMY